MSDEDDDDGAAGGSAFDPEAIARPLRAVRSPKGPTLREVLLLVQACVDKRLALVPQPLVDAAVAKWTLDGDMENGGADQFVWNQGATATRRVASHLRAVGAAENADLFGSLADALDEMSPVADAVQGFLAYRKRVEGPSFPVPEPATELAEALVEYAVAHAAECHDPDLPLPVPVVAQDPPQTGQ